MWGRRRRREVQHGGEDGVQCSSSIVAVWGRRRRRKVQHGGEDGAKCSSSMVAG